MLDPPLDGVFQVRVTLAAEPAAVTWEGASGTVAGTTLTALDLEPSPAPVTALTR